MATEADNILGIETTPLNVDPILNPIPYVDPAAHRTDRAMALTDPSAYEGTYWALKQQFAEQAILKRADTLISQDLTPETQVEITELADRLGTVDPSDVEWGAYESLIGPDEEPIYNSQKDWKATQKAAREYALEKIAEARKGNADRQTAPERALRAGVPIIGAVAINKLAGTNLPESITPPGILVSDFLFGKDAPLPEAAVEFASITHSQRVVNILQEINPDMFGDTEWNWDADALKSRAAVGTAITRFQKWMQTLPLAEQKVIIDHAAHAAKEQSQFLFDSPTQETILLEAIFDGLDDPDPSHRLNSLVGWMEIAAVPGITKIPKAVSILSRAAGDVGVGLRTGSFEQLIAHTKQGATNIWQHIRGRAAVTPANEIPDGTSLADLINDIAMPQVGGKPLDNMFLPWEYLPEGTKQKFLSSPEYAFGDQGVTPRLIGVHSPRLIDDEIEVTVRLGSLRGSGYSSEAAVTGIRDRWFQGTSMKVVQGEDKLWYLETNSHRPFGLGDITEGFENPLRRGYGFFKFFGQSSSLSDELGFSKNFAVRQGEKSAHAIRTMLDDFWSLPATSRQKTAEALDWADEISAPGKPGVTIQDLRNRGMNDAEIRGFAAVRRMADLDWQIAGARMYAHYTAEGYRGVQIPGHAPMGAKVLANADEAVQMTGRNRDAIRAVEVATGGKRQVSTLQSDEVLLKLVHPTQSGEIFAILKANRVDDLPGFPTNPIPYRADYLPRPYRYPVWVKYRDENGVMISYKPARSPKEAEKIITDLRANYPDRDWHAVRTTELRDRPGGYDELEQLYEAGLLNTSVRGPDRMVDIGGHPRMFSVEDRIRSMMTKAADAQGLSLWARAQERAWIAKYGHLFQNSVTLGMDAEKILPNPAVIQATLNGEKQVQEALAVLRMIQNATGLGPKQGQLLTQATRNKIADALYNIGTTSPVLKNKFRALGDEVSGMSSQISASWRTAAYVGFLSSNPIRQLPLQMTMIPSFAGISGGLKYGAGDYWRHMPLLLSDMLGGKATPAIAKALGISPTELKVLQEQFARTGIPESVSGHVLNAGQIQDLGQQKITVFGDAMRSTHTMLRALGINAGIIAEKMSGWLFARNRWYTLNPGKTPDIHGERQIAHWAEDLSQNQHKGDTIFVNRGALAWWGQFRTHQVKIQGRILSMLPGGPGSGPWTQTEVRRMAGAHLLFWGARGFGFGDVAAQVVNHPVLARLGPAAQQVAQIIEDGLIDMATNHTLQAFDDQRDPETRLAITESFSPVFPVGGTYKYWLNLVEAIGAQDPGLMLEMWQNTPFQPATVGLAENAADVMAFGLRLAFIPSPAEDDWLRTSAFIERGSRMFPVTNNVVKFLHAKNYGQLIDRYGNNVTESSKSSAWGYLLGTRDQREIAIRRMQLLQYGSTLKGEDIIKGVRDQARENSKLLFPLIDQFVERGATLTELNEALDTHNLFDATGLGEEYYPVYLDEIRNLFAQRGDSRYERVVLAFMDAIGTPDLPLTEATARKIDALGLDPDARKLIDERVNQLMTTRTP